MSTVVLLILLVAATSSCESSAGMAKNGRLLVPMTLVRNSSVLGAYCLDGSWPAYHLHRGFGTGARNWLLQFEGGGWCNDLKSCSDRANSRRGSTKLMTKFEVFSGILSNNASLNPDFHNWNRVKIRYCDGASFAGDSIFSNDTTVLYFRGQRIWQSIILDLLPKGLKYARKGLLSGCSAGGLASFLHCDNFRSYLPKHAIVKCLSDAGFFLDARDIALNHTMRSFFEDLVTLQSRPKGTHISDFLHLFDNTKMKTNTLHNNGAYCCMFRSIAVAGPDSPEFPKSIPPSIIPTLIDHEQFLHWKKGLKWMTTSFQFDPSTREEAEAEEENASLCFR